MRKIVIILTVCAFALCSSVTARQVQKPSLHQKLLENGKGNLKVSVIGSYPQRVKESHWAETGWELWQNIKIVYNSYGSPTEIIYEMGENSQIRKKYSYDDAGYRTEILTQYLNDGNWENQERQSWKYGENKSYRTFLSETWADGNWQLTDGQNQSYSYDESDRLDEEILTQYDSGKGVWENMQKNKYYYPGSDEQYNMVYIFLWAGQWDLIQRWDYTWRTSLDFDVITKMANPLQEDFWTIQGKTTYYLENQNLIITNYGYLPDNGGEYRATDRIRMPADVHGNPTGNYFERNITDEGWVIEYGTRYDLTYSGNNLAERITEEFNIYESPYWKLAVMEEFSDFASMGVEVPSLSDAGLTFFPNPAGDQTRVSLAGEWSGTVTLSVFSMTGLKISQQPFAVSGLAINLNLNLTGLSPGIYLVTASDGLGRDLGRKILIRE
jgi:hypothetical protein